jgi:AcrR family transcriptional regulator
VTTGDPKTRERILDVAFLLFVEVGFTGTTVTKIEHRAGLTAGSGGFYRHFRSKEDLLPAAVEREVTRCMEAIEESRAAHPTIQDPARARKMWLEEVLKHIRRFDPLMRLMLNDGHRVPEVRNAISAALQALGEQMSWQQYPELTACLAAMGGYHLFSEIQGRPFQDVAQDDFIRVLVTMTSEVP